jgi:hypothetical protein
MPIFKQYLARWLNFVDPRIDVILARLDKQDSVLKQINADVLANRQASAQKTHQLSNFMMAVENKVDELAEYITLVDPYSANENERSD